MVRNNIKYHLILLNGNRRHFSTYHHQLFRDCTYVFNICVFKQYLLVGCKNGSSSRSTFEVASLIYESFRQACIYKSLGKYRVGLRQSGNTTPHKIHTLKNTVSFVCLATSCLNTYFVNTTSLNEFL